MTDEQREAEVDALIARLPELPVPWDIAELCERLAVLRGRPVIVREMDIPALPFAFWRGTDSADFIVHRTGMTGYYRDHVILHEVCHMLAGHNVTETGGTQADSRTDEDINEQLLEQAAHNPHTTEQEELAERFATTVLRLAKQARPAPKSEFEQRAASMFGAQ